MSPNAHFVTQLRYLGLGKLFYIDAWVCAADVHPLLKTNMLKCTRKVLTDMPAYGNCLEIGKSYYQDLPLAKRDLVSSFVRGFIMALEEPAPRRRYVYRRVSPIDAMRQDWWTLGGDMRLAVTEYAEKTSRTASTPSR